MTIDDYKELAMQKAITDSLQAKADSAMAQLKVAEFDQYFQNRKWELERWEETIKEKAGRLSDNYQYYKDKASNQDHHIQKIEEELKNLRATVQMLLDSRGGESSEKQTKE